MVVAAALVIVGLFLHGDVIGLGVTLPLYAGFIFFGLLVSVGLTWLLAELGWLDFAEVDSIFKFRGWIVIITLFVLFYILHLYWLSPDVDLFSY